MPAVPTDPPSIPIDEPFQGPMPPEEWAEIPPAKKQQMIPSYHQSIVHSATEHVRAALLQSITSVVAKGGNPTQAMAIIAQWDDPVFKDMPKATRKKLTRKIMVDGKALAYLVIPYERDLWTGGPGAPDWPTTHPYKEQMLKLCEEPDHAQLWVAIFAGGAASVQQLGDKPERKPEETGGTEIEIVAEAPSDSQTTDPTAPPTSP